MIGVHFLHRREEFLEYTSRHPIKFVEIFDVFQISDTIIETLYVDGPVNITGPFAIVDVKEKPFSEIFSQPLINHFECKNRADLLFQFDYFQNEIKKDVQSFQLKPLSEEISGNSNEVHEQRILLEDNPLADMDTRVNESLYIDVSYEPQIENDVANIDVDVIPEKDSEPDMHLSAPTTAIFSNDNKQQYNETTKRSVHDDIFTSLSFPSEKKQTLSAIRGTSLPTGFVKAKNMSRQKKMFQVPIFTFCGLTDRAGVSTLVSSLAVALSIQNPSAKILYLDLDMSNPNYLLNFLNLNPNTDASVKTVIQLNEAEFMRNISLLTETVTISQATFSLITWGQMSFQEKRSLASQDFNYFLNTVGNSFDLILVDLGKLQSTLEYQLKLLSSNASKHILVADGSTNRNINVFIQLAKQITCNFEVVVNKDMPQSGSFAIRQQLRQSPLTCIGFHRNIERYLNNQMPIQGTAFEADLNNLGGKL